MESVKRVASYVVKKYKDITSREIDQMSLHKILYFAQRESYAVLDRPMFSAEFYAGQYGPVIISVRNVFPDKLTMMPSEDFISEFGDVLDDVIQKYSAKDAWSLSALSHNEISWKNARDKAADSRTYPLMQESDIRLDGLKLRMRKQQLNQI